MTTNTKTTHCCPACQRFEVLDTICGWGLPALCSACAEAIIMEREWMHETEQRGPTSVERAIAAYADAQHERAAEVGLSNPDDYPADYCGR